MQALSSTPNIWETAGIAHPGSIHAGPGNANNLDSPNSGRTRARSGDAPDRPMHMMKPKVKKPLCNRKTALVGSYLTFTHTWASRRNFTRLYTAVLCCEGQILSIHSFRCCWRSDLTCSLCSAACIFGCIFLGGTNKWFYSSSSSSRAKKSQHPKKVQK